MEKMQSRYRNRIGTTVASPESVHHQAFCLSENDQAHISGGCRRIPSGLPASTNNNNNIVQQLLQVGVCLCSQCHAGCLNRVGDRNEFWHCDGDT